MAHSTRHLPRGVFRKAFHTLMSSASWPRVPLSSVLTSFASFSTPAARPPPQDPRHSFDTPSTLLRHSFHPYASPSPPSQQTFPPRPKRCYHSLLSYPYSFWQRLPLVNPSRWAAPDASLAPLWLPEWRSRTPPHAPLEQCTLLRQYVLSCWWPVSLRTDRFDHSALLRPP